MQINFFSLIVAIGALTLSSCQFLSSDDHSGTSAILLVTDKYEEENAYYIVAETLEESEHKIEYELEVNDVNTWNLIKVNYEYGFGLIHDENHVGELSTIEHVSTP